MASAADYNALTVKALKAELEKRGVDMKGLKLKKEFVDKLVQDDEEKAPTGEETAAEGEDESMAEEEDAPAVEKKDTPVAEQKDAAVVEDNEQEGKINEEKQEKKEETDVAASTLAQMPRGKQNDENPPDGQEVTKSSSESPAQMEPPSPAKQEGTTDSKQQDGQESTADEAPPQEHKTSQKAENPSEPITTLTAETLQHHSEHEEDPEKGEPQTKGGDEPPETPAIEGDASPTGRRHGLPLQHARTVEEALSPKDRAAAIDSAADDPVAETDDARKRKRRSLTPPVQDQEIRRKRLRPSALGPPEDHEMTGAADDVNDQQMALQKDEAMVDAPMTDVTVAEDDGVEDDDTVEPSVHPITKALYIGNLMRPLQVQNFKSHLERLARTHQGQLQELIESFYIDQIRTHAFVVLKSNGAASRIRNRLHLKVWPDERSRKPLWVDYVPAEKVNEWTELESTTGKDKRWEVSYYNAQDQVVAELRETSSNTGGHPSAPTKPAQDRPDLANDGFNPPTGPRSLRVAAENQRMRPQRSQPETPQFVALEQLFDSTEARPKLYYKPVDRDLARARLDVLDRETTRRGSFPRDGCGHDDSTRYTFVDGDKLVSDGPEFGLLRTAMMRDGRNGGGGGGGGRNRGGRRDRY